MSFSVDWAAFWSGMTAGGAGLLAAAASYGALRQRVATQESRSTAQDLRMDRMEVAIERASSIANEVNLLRQSTESGHKLLAEQQRAAQELQGTKFDGLAGEVRSFMQGQASAGLGVTPPPRGARRTG